MSLVLLGSADDYNDYHLVVTGTAKLSGQLTVQFIGSPANGNSYSLVTAGSSSGTFPYVSLPSVRGITLTPQYSTTGVILAASGSGDQVPLPTEKTYAPADDDSTYVNPGPVEVVSAHTGETASNPNTGTGASSEAQTTAAADTTAKDAVPATVSNFTSINGLGLFLTPAGGGNSGATLSNRTADAAVSMGDVNSGATTARLGSTALALAASDRSSGKVAEEELPEDLTGALPLAVPGLELSADQDLPTSSDVAASLLVGGRPRHHPLPDRLATVRGWRGGDVRGGGRAGRDAPVLAAGGPFHEPAEGPARVAAVADRPAQAITRAGSLDGNACRRA